MLFIVVLLLFGINLSGVQRNFEIHGTVIEKKIEKSERDSHYKLMVRDNQNDATHELDVSNDVFEHFSQKKEIVIKGKKGSLGLVYDIWFSK